MFVGTIHITMLCWMHLKGNKNYTNLYTLTSAILDSDDSDDMK